MVVRIKDLIMLDKETGEIDFRLCKVNEISKKVWLALFKSEVYRLHLYDGEASIDIEIVDFQRRLILIHYQDSFSDSIKFGKYEELKDVKILEEKDGEVRVVKLENPDKVIE